VHALAVALKHERGIRRPVVRPLARRLPHQHRILRQAGERLPRATRPAGHRIIFLVDEVGQFIGDNTQLMLNLQTITEQLGTQCKGRAWVIVTSQEDIDAAIGEANKAKSQDFSKIQGRFHTRLSLASSNTDEVIGERLLAKTEAAHDRAARCLRQVRRHHQQPARLRRQLGQPARLQGRRRVRRVYPYAPYQFTLLQKIFESIRKVGATGKHLSRGERSLLDAFQSAAVRNMDRDVDLLVPLYDFYPSIESFIDTVAKRSIDEAPNNGALEALRRLLLKALFLIRYIPDIVKPNVDNLATLCVDQIDADKLALKRKIQESLGPAGAAAPGQPQRRPVVLPHQRRARRRPRDRPRRSVCRRKGPPAVPSCCSTNILGRADQGAPPRHQGRLRIQPPARRRPLANASHELTFEVV
jgi:hypothetical protein